MPVTANIKMYRVGELGDCFLLCFSQQNQRTHVLIDCGSYWNKKSSVDRMKIIAEDIAKQVKGYQLDVVVGTHQHNDHLSGYVHAEAVFKKIKPRQVWLSWLDDPDNKTARKIGKDFNNYLTRLRLIQKELKSSFYAGTEKIQQNIQHLLGFYGITGAERFNARTEKFPADLPARATGILKTLGKNKPKYLSPGEVFNLPGLGKETVKVYVLGPPREEEFLYKKEPGKGETFDHKLSLHAAQAEKMLTALKKATGSAGVRKAEEPFPFDEPYRESANFKPVEDAYYDKKNEWRQIELDWLNQAEELALWLDGFTNNSSLVLAFELVETGKVLLFAADAQAGNWRSWKEIKWKKKPAGFSWLNLMNNTVLYKAGHHGSHNSTLVEGLENMTHEELVVMIPVEKSDPMVNYGKGWKMPAVNLYKELKKSSRNRIIRMDEGISKAKAWNDLAGKAGGNSLYWEYDVKG